MCTIMISIYRSINLWATIKRRVYPTDKQYTSQKQLWEAIKDVCAALEPQEIQNLTSSMDNRLFKVIQKTGSYIGIYLRLHTCMKICL